MCDTVVIVRPDRVLFAKNSDRDPNEAQIPEWHPRGLHAAGAMLRCTWIEIPQVRETAAVLISRPYWMWGAEMGANEHGAVIGNEAVFTKQPYAPSGLTGMDLVRLGLERGETARHACDIIVQRLQEHGQGGGCGLENRQFTYHNRFLIADARGAIVLETAGRKWAAEHVYGPRSISNGLTIPEFAALHSDSLRTHMCACRMRRARTEESARSALSRISRRNGTLSSLDGWPPPRQAPAHSPDTRVLSSGGLTAPRTGRTGIHGRGGPGATGEDAIAGHASMSSVAVRSRGCCRLIDSGRETRIR